MEKRKKRVKKKTQKEKEELKEQKEIKNLSYDEKILEEKIKELNKELKENNPSSPIEPQRFISQSPLKEVETKKGVAHPIRLERSIISSNPSITKEIEDDSIEYTPLIGEKKKEEKYNILSKDYSVMQKEARRQNPNFLVQSDFEEFTKKNISENFQKRNINPFAEESLKSSNKNNEEYFVKSSFTEKERKPHNPFEKKEIKYDTIGQ
ncbi:MAG TPA: hypothetical protein PK357_01425 [Candidatus Pacearchaeota archaeon]|nr:hypothetical protein [Candidatus Pacearchaeota archaeon]